MLPDKYHKFVEDLHKLIPPARLITDPLRTLAFGTDASFYRLIPKLVVKADSEKEVSQIVKAADQHEVARPDGLRRDGPILGPVDPVH